MRKLKLFTFLLALATSVGLSWATTNSITINESSHGSVVASSSSAAAGETITLTATPDDGYQLKSISGVYVPVSETLNATSETVNGNKFQAQATSRNNYGWRVYNPGTANTLTVSSLNGTTLITKIEFTSTWGNGRTNNMLSVSAGTLSFNGTPATTVTINDINATSVTISGSGSNAGQTWCIKSVKVYYTATIENELEISDTENANVKTFTMVDSEVTISAEFAAVASTPAVIDLATITTDYVIPDGATLTGTLQNNVVLTVADNATITLSNVDINWNKTWTGGDHAGITCDNATIILAECTTNKIRGFLDGNPGVYVRQNKTITIQGTGTLYAETNGGAAAIGSGYGAQNSSARYGGNIIIKDGTIFATGGNLGAGIGAGGRSKVGNITIQGGIITATGGGSAAGIGCGQTKNSGWKAQCGNITITNGVKYLKATKGSGSDQCIGKGSNSSNAVCGTVTINGTTGAISNSPYTYSPAADNVKNLINAIGSVAYTQACKDKIDAARAAYEALADYSCDVNAVNALKAAVSNYSTLTAAEAAYNTLVANAVVDKINAIGSPITAADQTAIEDARAAYNALTDTQKGYVTNYSELTDAEAVLAVVNLINAIGSPITAASQSAIEDARNAYDALTGDQQALVGNYATLTDAEAAYAALTPSADPTIFAGFTATDGCGGFGGEGHDKLVDGLFAPGNEGVNWTKWCADGQHKSVPSGESEACWWVDFNAANPIAVTGYILTTGNDNTQWGEGRNPNSWKIKAKLNAGDAWTTIATVTNDNTMQVADFTDFSFTLDQAGTYKYFRFMVYEPEYDDCMQLCEFRFTGNGGSTPEPPSINDILQELYDALGNDVWAGYGEQTGVITYAQGTEPNSFKATFMGGAYAIEIPFGDFTQAEKVDNGNGTYTYNLDVNLPAQTGLSHEVLHVTMNANGEITGIHSDIAQTDMNKVGGAIATWADLNAAMANGGVLQLSQSLTATNLDGALIVPAGKTVVLDLNGFSLDRHLASAQADGCVIINNGTLAITDNVGGAEIKGGYNSDNGGGIVNNGTFTLYGGKITGNHAAQGAGVYNSVANNGTVGFWMTGGQIADNDASSYKAIKGDVTFSNLAVVQINEGGNTVSAATAIAGLATYDYIKPVMPNMDMFAILAELYDALGTDVWAGYGEQTGVITYAQGIEQNSFEATFMGGAYTIEIPFGDFTQAEKVDNGNGTYTYNLDVNLPAQTGLSHEVLHVTMNANGEITGIHSDIAQTDMNKVGGAIASWADLNAAMANGGVLQLSQSLTATNLDGALIVPAGKTVVLDLNGFSLDRHLASAQADGCVIINNGTLAITDNVGGAEIKGGYNSGNGGGIVNNGTFTLYGGKITGNHAAQGAGVYNSVANNGTVGFWMTGGQIADNDASSYKAIKGDVTFSNLAVVQINEGGNTVSAATAIAGLATYDYIKPVMPNMDMFAILAELYDALGTDVWAGYGEQTGVITYAQGMEQNSFEATFMGGAYSIEIPFGDFTQAEKVDNGDGSYTYNLDVNLPAQTGLSHEVLHVTVNSNGEITGIHSDIAQTDMNKVGGAIATWADLNAAMANGGVLQLSQSLTATNLDGALIVPAGKTVVLDLNGFSLDRHLASAQADGCVIINNGTLAITDNVGGAEIKGGYNSGNGGGIVNNGTLTLYGGKITGNHAAQGAGVYNSVANDGTVGFWMTGGLIAGNEAASYPAIKGDVTFSNLAVVQINEGGNTVSATTAIAGLATYDYIQPVMPNMDMFAILAELHAALGDDVWTGYGTQTGVISYAQGDEPNSFKATFMGGTYEIEIPFGDFTQAEKVDNGDGTFTYNLNVNLPAQTGMDHEVLHVTTNANGEILAMESENAGVELQKETDGTIATWADLQNALNEGGLIKLTNDIVGGNAPLVIPADKTVVLDLNGHTINRGMSSAAENGSVIVNNGTLAIVDNSDLANGVITGGNTTGKGGGILNNGIFTLYDGEITGNHADEIGGGVYNNGGAQGFWMTGGLIDGNTATTSNPAIGGAVIFNNMAVVQINADGDKVSIDEAIAGLSTYGYIQPVMPDYNDYTTEVAITANVDPKNPTVYYSTFYDSANKYMLPAGVEAYVADLSGDDLVLTKIAGAGQVIPADEAVILKASVANFNLTLSFEAPVSVSTNNDLEGVDVATPLVDLSINQAECYVLSGTAQYGVGFYKINVDYLKAHKAYVIYDGNLSSAPKRMRFVFDQATDVESIQPSAVSIQKILENGQVIIIRNGAKYNVSGQIVR